MIRFFKHILTWAIVIILSVMVVCPDLRPGDIMFERIGYLGKFIWWAIHLVMWFAAGMAILIITQGDDANKARMLSRHRTVPKFYRVMGWTRTILCVIWLAFFGHFFMAASLLGVALLIGLVVSDLDERKRKLMKTTDV